MAYPFIFTKEAQNEFENSVHWYLNRNEKAANNFVISVNNTLELISNHPYRWKNPYANYFELQVRKYPFSVVYVVENNERIVIISVFHHKRNPSRKYQSSNG